MSLLPCLGETSDTEDWNDTQLWTFVVCTYLICSLYLLEIGIASANFMRFVVKADKCEASDPLLLFYILVILCLLSDTWYTIFLVSLYDHWMPLTLFAPPTFKVLSGLAQA